MSIATADLLIPGSYRNCHAGSKKIALSNLLSLCSALAGPEKQGDHMKLQEICQF